MTSPDTLAAVEPPARSIESALLNRWARIFIPSLSDLFFLSILAWLFVAGAYGWKGLLVDGDVGWHIRSGEYILAHHAVPRHDLYSFSQPGAPWYAWEWLTDVLDASLYGLAGLKGIVLSAGIVIAVFATTLLRRMIWRGASPLIAMMVALLGVGAASIHFLARPHIFTLLLLSISMWMLEADREHPSRRIWWLVPLTTVWTNLHGGFLALIAVLGLAAAGTAVEAWLGRSAEGPRGSRSLSKIWSSPARYALLTAGCAAASLVNPYGYHLHVHMAEYLRSDWIRSAIQEFQSPSFRSENMLQFETLLLAGLMAAASLLRRGRVVEALWIVVFAHMALGSARHVPIFVTVAAPVIAAEICRWWESATRSARKGSLPAIVNAIAADSAGGFRRSSAWPAMAMVALILMRGLMRWPQDFPDEVFPAKMVHAHAAEILRSRVLTTDQWADYLIYTDPSQKVFVDGRSDFYGPEIGNQYLRILNGQWDWEQLMVKYGFNLVLLQTDLPIVQLLKRSAGWTVIEDNGKQILLRRSAPARSAGNYRPEPRS